MKMFGKHFFAIDLPTLEIFFNGYAGKYGKSAATYAKRAYAEWKTGVINPSGKTSERLLETLPPFLSFSAKCELLRKLREHHSRPETYDITVSTSSWRELIPPLVENVIHRAYTAELPADVENRLQWLSSGSMQAAKALLAEVEVQAGNQTTQHLSREFEDIARLVANLPNHKETTHAIALPYGTIRVTITRRAKMNEDDNRRDLVPQNQHSDRDREIRQGFYKTR